jgi:hypothetical protein
MPKSLIVAYVTALAALTSGIILFASRHQHLLAHKSSPESTLSLHTKNLVPDSVKTALSTSRPAALHLLEPSELTGFSLDAPDTQLARITELESNPNLSPNMVAYLTQLLTEKSLEQTIRNNVANALLNQPKPDPCLYQTLATMIDDPSESYQWREFAVEHLAISYRTSARPDLIIEKLKLLARTGEKGIPGTALLQLHRLADDGFNTWDEDCTHTVLAAIGDPAADVMTRMTAIGLAGERREVAALSLIRSIAADGATPLKRVALATLGIIGDASDLDLLRSFASGEEETTRTAATHAITRLVRSNQATEIEPTRGF